MSWVENISPGKIGMPAKFTEWRPVQAQAIEDALDSDARFVMMNAPLGIGKTGVGAGIALLEGLANKGSRAVYLTSTRALQEQIERDGLPMVKIQGRGNYQCSDMGGAYTCEEWSRWCKVKTCHLTKARGAAHRSECSVYECDGWSGQCAYKRAYQAAMRAALVQTNYSYWLSVGRFQQSLGAVDVLICDEAHAAPDEVCHALQTTITHGDMGLTSVELPKDPRDLSSWPHWAKQVLADMALHPITLETPGYSHKQAMAIIKRREKLAEKCATLMDMYGDWVVEPGRDGWQFDPVWPYQHAEKALFRGIPKVILMSGTVTRKTMALLGIARDKYDSFSYPYVFPRAHNPIYHLKTGVINKNSKPETLENWYRTIGNIIRKRADRKGIVHTVSYRRAEEIKEWLDRNMPEAGRLCVTHDGPGTQEAIRKHKSSRNPQYLLSPSLTTGYDFPMEECEVVIWCKLPFPMTQSAAMKARAAKDKLYSGHVMIQELIQGTGRPMRSSDDRAECFILDDSWFWASKRYAGFIVPWFRVRTIEYIPRAPKSIREIQREAQEAREGAV